MAYNSMSHRFKDQLYDQYRTEKTSVLIASVLVVAVAIAISLIFIGLTN